MDMNVLKYMAFVKTVEYGSFTRAAEVLHYSQSGVSRMIRDLEREWNLSLLERSRSGVRLTSDGQQLLPYAQRLCRDYEQLQMQVDDLHGLQSGLIRIAALSSIASHWLPGIIRAFQRDYPHIDYELQLGNYDEVPRWLAEGRVDGAFTALLPGQETLTAIPLERDELVAVLPMDHPLAKRERVPLEALALEPLIMDSPLHHKPEVSALFRSRGLSPRFHFTAWEDYTIMIMVEGGMGVGIMPRLVLQRAPCRLAIRPLEEPAYRELGFLMHSRETTSLAMRRFLQYLDRRNDMAEAPDCLPPV